MIQFNLLPDVKLEYIKTERLKRAVVGISLLASVVALVIFIFLLMAVDVFQKKNINDLGKEITAASQQLKQNKELPKMLTVQSQLKSLPALHDQKPSTSRIFGFMDQLTPDKASISELNLDMTAGTLSITGTASGLSVVNEMADALKYSTYTAGDDSAPKNAFSNVVLSSFDRNEKNATFTLDFNFDPLIFDNANDVSLKVNKTAADQAAAVIIKNGQQ
ncbi:MAG TPA: hypothetical protein VFL85_03400 [Candidatus Saccharimonadales bacterium]|nr:hypothetical protein [Candidatus Saccharimonadales bacterium]